MLRAEKNVRAWEYCRKALRHNKSLEPTSEGYEQVNRTSSLRCQWRDFCSAVQLNRYVASVSGCGGNLKSICWYSRLSCFEVVGEAIVATVLDC